jgi:hypothetical protein
MQAGGGPVIGPGPSSSGFSDYAGYAVGGVSLIVMFWQWLGNRRVANAQAMATEADATGKTGLIDALEARIKAGEDRQNAQDVRIGDLVKRLEEEITLRHQAQEENLKLRLRVTELEFAIRQLGGTVPNASGA